MKFERTCVACRKKGNKSDFVKFVLNKNKEIFIDENKNLPGRGAYVCKDPKCLKQCVKSKSLNRTFKFNVPQEFYEEIVSKFGIEQN